MTHLIRLTLDNPDSPSIPVPAPLEGLYRTPFPIPALDLDKGALLLEPAEGLGDGPELGPLPCNILEALEASASTRTTQGDLGPPELQAKRLDRFRAALAPCPEGLSYEQRRGYTRQCAHVAFSFGVAPESATAELLGMGIATEALASVYEHGSPFVAWAEVDKEIEADERAAAAELENEAKRHEAAAKREVEDATPIRKRGDEVFPGVELFAVILPMPYASTAPVAILSAETFMSLGEKLVPCETTFGTMRGFPVKTHGFNFDRAIEAPGLAVVPACQVTIEGSPKELRRMRSEVPVREAIMVGYPTTRNGAPSTSFLDFVADNATVDTSNVSAKDFKSPRDVSHAHNLAQFRENARPMIALALENIEQHRRTTLKNRIASLACARLFHPDVASATVESIAREVWESLGRKDKGSSRKDKEGRPVFDFVAAPLPLEWRASEFLATIERVYSGLGREKLPGQDWQEAPANQIHRTIAAKPGQDPWRELVTAYLEGLDFTTSTDVFRHLRDAGHVETQDPAVSSRIYQLLLSLGWERKTRKSKWIWVPGREATKRGGE